ncbi:DUF2945 domain-containing protein [Streptomyces sp. NPDC059524]|uniref:DUF2945 domain-containing protein n=1 Tax=Streptomyces sp. NPDC059524 TaxID=3346856 RepID=UPI0036A185BE
MRCRRDAGGAALSRDVEWKGYTHHCSESDPQYEIRSDRTDHIALHKGGALTKVPGP